eukprot:1717729-Rhodomonas_salina.2
MSFLANSRRDVYVYIRAPATSAPASTFPRPLGIPGVTADFAMRTTEQADFTNKVPLSAWSVSNASIKSRTRMSCSFSSADEGESESIGSCKIS